jgi:Ni/Fe-hydrogenase subunit HybB-like protein
MDVLLKIARAMPYVIGTYLVLRFGDLVARGVVFDTVAVSFRALWFWLEIHLCVVSLALYANPDALRRKTTLLLASVASVLAVVFHRVGVTMVGMSVPEYPPYHPSWVEWVMGIGLIAMGLLAFRLIVHWFPVYDEQVRGHAQEAQLAEVEEEPVLVGTV